MQYSFPQKTENLDSVQLKDLKNRRSKNSVPLEQFGRHVYRKDSILIYYTYLSSPPIPYGHPDLLESLEDNQRMLVGAFSSKELQSNNPYIVDTSTIVSYNNIRFSIIEYHHHNVYYLRFRSDYDKKLRYIAGNVEFKKPDEESAKLYLNEFLQSMHFKQ